MKMYIVQIWYEIVMINIPHYNLERINLQHASLTRGRKIQPRVDAENQQQGSMPPDVNVTHIVT